MRLPRFLWSRRRRREDAALHARVQALLDQQTEHDRARRIQLIHQTLC